MNELSSGMMKKLEAACLRLENIWAMEESLHEFVKGCWPIISGGYTFQDGWAIQAVCSHLEAVERGDIKRLLINLPPRTGKSLVCSVAFPVWCWLRNPALNVMGISYVDDLSQRDNVKSRRLIQSSWFQNNWGADRIRLASDQNTKDRMTTTAGGDRLAVSFMGGITGDGADIIVCLPYESMIQTDCGARMIGEIVEGEADCKVLSFNHETGLTEYKAIEAHEKNPGRELYEIELDDGTKVSMTAEHPVWIEGKGYIRVDEVCQGDRVVSLT
jgi:hypothetical protein